MHPQFSPFTDRLRQLTSTRTGGTRRSTVSRFRHVVPVAVLAVALAGCGGDNETSDAASTSTSAGLEAETTTTPDEATTLAAPTDVTLACDRLTADELTTALGQPFGSGTPNDDGSVCLWEADVSNQVTLTIRTGSATAPELRCDTMATPNSERLEIDGHPAALEGKQIYVCGEDQTFNMLFNVSLPEDQMRTALVDLATVGVAR